MKKLRWQLVIIFLTGLVVGVLLISEQPGVFPTLAPEPVRGGVYVEGLVGNLQRLNPLLDFYNPVDRDVNRLIYSGLIRFDGRGVPQPDLAESWGFSKDGTIYNFELRPNIKWHDGEPLTSQDVAFTIDLMREENEIVPADLQAFWNEVEVFAPSDTTLQFKLPEPFAPFLDYLSFGVLPQHLLGDRSFADMVDAPFNLQPVGSGPYQFDQLILEGNEIKGVTLSVFEDYYAKKPFLEQIVFRYYPDAATAFSAYQDGIVQGISQVTPDILPEVLAEPELAVYTGRRPQLTMVLFNLNNPQVPFFEEKEVRLALLKGLNRRFIVDRLLGGQAIPADGPIFPGTWAHYDELKPADYDPEKAVVLLKEAGYEMSSEESPVRKKENISLAFTLLHPDDEGHRLIAEAIQEEWEKLGIRVDLEPVPYEELINGRLVPRSYQAALVDLNLSRSPDPDPYPFWDQAQATGGQNYSQWDDRNASEYLEQARVTADMGERARLYRNFQFVFNDEMPALPLYYPVYTYAVDRKIQGVSMGPLIDTSDRFETILNWFLIARMPNQQDGSGVTVTP
ncbi:MAG: hypothetical protein IT308_07665 [Anaerolineaceae bacterium]|nr:hypothetical protein [Anaerolineaceae bacterium]